MIIRKAYKFRLKPSEAQIKQLIAIAGACRFLWNKVLRLNLNRLQEKNCLLWYHEADYWSKLWKSSQEYTFLKEAPAHCLQQKLKDLEKAFKDAFDKTQPLKRLPRMKKRNINDSFRFPDPKQFVIANRRIKLPKLGWIGFHKSREIEGQIRNATVSQEAGHWYVSIQVESELGELCHLATSCVGIDVGITQFATLSEGSPIKSLHVFRKWEKKLAKAQRALARKIKWSQNWKKQKASIQTLHRKIANTRRDFLHKSSTNLCKSHAMIVVEDLKITNMSRSAKGTLDEPGINVKQKSGLNKSILDQGWGEFKRQLEYKLTWLGGLFLKVSPKHTSQKCNLCGHTSSANRINQSEFVCQACGYKANADVNAAKNILAAGYAVIACGEVGLPTSMKQEPLRNCEIVAA